MALRWDCASLRCSGCGHVFTALLPEQARGPKYSESAASMMIVLRYGTGVPLHRLETMQRLLGVPVPASTQWEIARDHVQEVLPVYNVLVSLAANAPLVHNDDTYVRILELMGKRRSRLIAAGDLDLPERTGLFTTGIVARTAAGPIALFASGRQHAGENLADLLDRRDPALGPPMQMCDGLDRNLPDEHAVVLANCLAHGRRHVVDEVGNHPELCAHLLDEIGKVFANDATCRKGGVTGEARLAFHQRESGPVMAGLRAWIEALFADKRVEPNSGLGGALRYLLTRWEALTLFLRVAGAPVDNNLLERCLKQAIRHRRASLFYRSRSGAVVGDIYMALLVTTQLHHGDPFRYLTALFMNYKAVMTAPADWLPWNYEATLARLNRRHAYAA
ncbi:MAG TPA: transposase [Albitalea sp.]